MSCAISAVKLLCVDMKMNEVHLVSLLGYRVSAAMAGCLARYAYVGSTEEPWSLGLQQDSLGRDISHMFLQFSAREKAHSMRPLKKDSEACTEPLRTIGLLMTQRKPSRMTLSETP